MRKDKAFQLSTQGSDDAINDQVADMRLLLRLMSGASATESLKALRAAFPDASLTARTSAIAGRGF